MGRIEAEVAAETIDVPPPPTEEDLYEPPHHYQPPPPPTTTTSQRSTPPPPQPQQFPPPQQDVHHFPPPQQDVHHFPPPDQDYAEVPPPAQFPPQYDPDHKPPVLPMGGKLFTPAPQQQTGQYVAGGNQYMQQQQQYMPPQQQQQYMPPQQQQQSPLQGIPVGVQQNQLPTEPWRTNIFDCMENPQNAIITLFFPCVTFGQIAEILDSGNTSCGTGGIMYSLIACCIVMPCLMSCTYRSKLRSKFGLVESPAPDWVIHCFCEWCALCQEYRELEARGYDPSIGWLGNVAKQQQQQQQFGMAPPMQQRMF